MAKYRHYMFEMKFLIIGCGSIGQRHIKNLLSLGKKNLVVFIQIKVY